MRKFLVVILLMFASLGYAQTYENGWAVGLSATSPRMFGDTYGEDLDLGAGLSLTREFDAYNAFRVKLSYLKFTSKGAPLGVVNGPSTDAVTFGINYLMTFNPCTDFIKVYGGAGFAVTAYKVTNPVRFVSDKTSLNEIALTVNLGVNLPVSKDFSTFLELGHHTLSTDKFDGLMGPNGGLFGGTLDSYTTLDLGIMYYFSRGKETKICDLPKGVSNEIDYKKIEKMINDAKVTPPPAPEIDYKKIEDMIKKNKPESTKPDAIDHEIVLVGINFDSGSAEIKSENFAILAQNAAQLIANKKVNVEIIGNTDSKGDLKGNNPLSVKRAQNVKDYLVSKGVEASRMTIKGVADTNPVADNSTKEGRALNRRVEFRIIK
ncbi:MAG: OmpA family protein [Bacteroidetes bacterium]|nr:OmpA family protein [Bacteroidota bacterium]